MHSSALGKIVCLLVVIGALNWGLIGLSSFLGDTEWNVVNMLLGSWPVVENIVYVLVGLAGVHKLVKCVSGKCCS